MKKYRFLSLLMVLTLFLSLLTPLAGAEAADDTPAEPAGTEPENLPAEPAAGEGGYTVQAKAALLLEMNSGQVLLAQDASVQVYPASLTKVMTCMLTLEHGNLSDVVTVSESALEGLDPAGSTAGLIAGEQMTVENLLYCMMLSSANEACNVAAEYIAGSVDAFVAMMNEEAAALGCTGTHFCNPHGLHDENHYTTARDLSLIAMKALEDETFRTITSTVYYEVPPTNLSDVRKLYTTNLLETPSTRYYYEYAVGVKTGYTTPAGRCLISTAERPDRKTKLLSVVCGAADVYLEDGVIENQNFTETKALFEYGFDTFDFAVVLEANPVVQTPVFHSAGSDVAVLAASEAITAVMPKDYDVEQVEKKIDLFSPDGVEAPIARGQVLGTVTVRFDGVDLGTTDLVAITDIARSEIAIQTATTKSFFSGPWLKILVGAAVALAALYLTAVAVNRARRRKRRKERRLRQQMGEVIEFPGNRRDGGLEP
ncbi:MAG: D-alanyl-D-alanine carboxypeptidase [Oscillospiraceae bacterium]|nr:D-alanyl-D-alanine carboxypeptidase [Oscillospiraceae bacterium]